MNVAELVPVLENIDGFYKNTLLLFKDLMSFVREKAYTGTLEDLTGPGYGYTVFHDKNEGVDSEHLQLWVFKHNGRIRFAIMLVKMSEGTLRGRSALYKSMCGQLQRNPRFPLLLIYGVFEPRDINRFRGDNNIRRHWVLNTALIDTREEQMYPEISELRFDNVFTLESKEGTDSWWCEKAKFVICDLATITDSLKLSGIADHLLKL